jgi:hypothetical protein
VKREMLVDRSPNAPPHGALTAEIRRYLLEICNISASVVAFPGGPNACFELANGDDADAGSTASSCWDHREAPARHGIGLVFW